MEHALRCNDMKCRAELRDRAVVTTCSHIFCVDCGNRSGLDGAPRDRRVCPACQTHLPRPDDAINAVLNPSEDYKTSVLSGLCPDAIMECAGRGLSFWSYQMVQDLTWESHRCKVLTARYNELSTTLDSVINDANAQITALHNKAASMTLDQDALRRKNQELSMAYKEKNRKLLQTQELYDKLKRKAMLGHIQDAALDAVDNTLHDGQAMRPNSMDRGENQGNYEQQFETPYNAPRYTDRLVQTARMPAQHRMDPSNIQNSAWARPELPRADMLATPSSHRQRLGGDSASLATVPGLVAGTPGGLCGEGRMRQPLNEMQPNQRPGSGVDHFARAGLSSHLKTSQGPGMTATAFVPTLRPRVAQRPSVPLFSAGPSM
ncbi:unnamed protein product [Discula destructiva]